MGVAGSNNFFKSGGGSGTGSALAGAKNYLTTYNSNAGNGDFELNLTTGWSLGTATVTSGLPTGAPTFGSGANGNLSFATTSSGKLAGAYSGSYASSAATTAGNFLASDAVTIDLEDQAKVMAFKFYYSATVGTTTANWSGTSSNSFGVAIYDVTNSVWIVPAGVFSMTQSSGVGYATGTFQTTSNSTSYRLVMYNANATSGAVTLLVDDFFLGPQASSLDSRVIDCAVTGSSTSLTSGGGTVIPTTVNRDSVGAFAIGTGLYTVAVAGDYLVSGTLHGPSSSLTTSQAVSLQLQKNGTAFGYAYARGNAAAVSITTTATGLASCVPGDVIRFQGFSDVTGNATGFYGSIYRLAGPTSGDEGRVIALDAFAQTPTGTLNGSFNVTKFGTINKDTSASYSTSTGLYTVPVSGFYKVYGVVEITASYTAAQHTDVKIYKNGTGGTGVSIGSFNSVGSATAFSASIPYNGLVDCVAGDTIAPYATSTGSSLSYSATTSASTLFIERLSGPAVASPAESVNARYYASATSVSGSLATVVWTTKDFDSHNGMASGIYTVPVSGKYHISAALALSGTFALNNQSNMVIQKNSVTVSELLDYAAGAETADHVLLSDTISCNAGDTLKVQVSSGATGPGIVSSNTKNYISIFRAGN